MAMRPPSYQIQGAPQLMNEPTAMEALTQFGLSKGLDYGLEAAFPGSSIAKEAGQAVLPTLFNEGGAVYLRPGGDLRERRDNLYQYLHGDKFGAGTRAETYKQGQDPKSWWSRQVAQRPGGGESTWGQNINRMMGDLANFDKQIAEADSAAEAEALAKKKAATEKKLEKASKKAPLSKPTPRPDPKAQGGVDWNVGLGNVGGWDLSTSGNYTLMDNAKDPYKVNLNAKRAFDTNALFGAAPLGGPAARGRYADYEGGEYQERMPGDPIRTNVARGRAPAADPLQAYLDAGISRDQAEMLAANKVPPPRPLQMGGPVYLNEGGQVPWWKAAARHVMKNDNMDKRVAAQQERFKKSKDKGEGDTFDMGAVLGSVLRAGFFNQGGKVSPAAGMYGPIGGMTPGPLGMSDMIQAGKDKTISKVMYKKSGGDVAQQVEISYHDPNKPKAPLAGGGSSDK